ncbi:MAG: hypothetical protein KJO69_01255 [Gammaproteobacteria bacterium]|nr:hypothetical protein [Gammaproteobacteria bacterium]
MKKNPVQKNLWKFNKKKVHEDKTKYHRKPKHLDNEEQDSENIDNEEQDSGKRDKS